MKVFVLRHAVTEEGEASVHQPSQSVLSADGINQAKQIATSFSSFGLDRIFSSPDGRANQTAAIISSHLETPVEVICHPDLYEMKKPVSYEGKSFDDPEVKEQRNQFMKNVADPNYRLLGGENLFDVHHRVMRVLTDLETQKFQRILVVTHSAVIRVMILSLYAKKEGISFENIVGLYPIIREKLEVENGKGFEISLTTVSGNLPEGELPLPVEVNWDFSFTALPELHLVSWRPPTGTESSP